MVSLRAIRSVIFSINALNQTNRVIANINVLTDMAQSLQHPAQSLKFLDSAQFLCDKGGFPGIVSNMTNMTTTVSHFLNEMTGKPSFEAGVVSQKIVDEFIIFGNVQQKALNVLIGKAGIFGLVPSIGAPIVSAFKEMEEGLDLFVASLSDKLQTGGGQIRARVASLFDTFDLAIDAYSGLHMDETRALRLARRKSDTVDKGRQILRRSAR